MEEVERERAAFAKERALAKSAKASGPVQGDIFGGMAVSGVAGAGTVEAPSVAVDASGKVQPGEVLMDLLFKRGPVEPEPFEALGEEDIVGLRYADIPSSEASPGKNFARSRAGRWVSTNILVFIRVSTGASRKACHVQHDTCKFQLQALIFGHE